MRLPPDHILIGLTGPAGSGKSTVADHLVEHHGFVADAFAEPIRDMLCALFAPIGVDPAWLHGRELKERPIPQFGASARQLMQTLGDWGRTPDEAFWVHHAGRRLGLDDLPRTPPVHDRIVISDVRFHNEARWIEALGGRIVRIVRDTKPVHAHASEEHFGHIKSWRRLENTGSLEVLLRDTDLLIGEMTRGILAGPPLDVTQR